MNIETISGSTRELALESEDFWKGWPKGKPEGYEQFLAWAEVGKPREPRKRPASVDQTKADQNFQRADLERSIRFCREELGLGMR